MSFSGTETQIIYTGDDAETTFEIPFKYENPLFVKVEVYNEDDPDSITATPWVKDTNWRFVDDETIETIELVLVGVSLVPTPTPVPLGTRFRIYRETADIHNTTYGTYQFPYATMNVDLDKVYQRLQELKRELNRAILISPMYEADARTVTGDEVVNQLEQLRIDITALEVELQALADSIAYQFDDINNQLNDLTGGSNEVYNGYSARFGELFDNLDTAQTLLQILNFAYLGPQITLSASPSQSVREKGASVTSVDLTATTTKRTNSIQAVKFYRAGVLVNTVSSPSAGGGTETFTSSTSFADTMTFYARAEDGTSVVQSNTITYSYVYPYYYGAGATGKTPAQVAALTKSIISSTSNLTVSFTTSNGDVYYFAYPSSYGALTSILDANGFETLGDWTLTTANITGLDASAVSYRIYSFNNPVIAGSTSYTFKR